MSDGSMKGFGQRGTDRPGKISFDDACYWSFGEEGLITVTLKEIHGVCK